MRPLSENDHVIHVTGVLDPAAARAILAASRGVPAEHGLVVDFSEAKLVDDVALAALAESLSTRLYRLRGLSTHHERLLRYLGLSSRTKPGAEARVVPLLVAEFEAA